MVSLVPRTRSKLTNFTSLDYFMLRSFYKIKSRYCIIEIKSSLPAFKLDKKHPDDFLNQIECVEHDGAVEKTIEQVFNKLP